MKYTRRLVVSILSSALCLFASRVQADQKALIIQGLAGSTSVASELANDAESIQKGLIQRGFSPEAIRILDTQESGNKATKETILKALGEDQGLGKENEFWLILLGFSGANSDGVPTFQVRGPRLTAKELKSALDAIPAKQFIFIGTSDSGGYIPLLLDSRRSVLSATKETGEIDWPRFPTFWAEALLQGPHAAWNAIAARAAKLTETDYIANHLAIGEHARLGDPESGLILQAPFGVTAPAEPDEKTGPGVPTTLLSASDIKVEIHDPNSEWERQPPTEETKKLIEIARATPNPDRFSSLLLEQRLGYTISEDRTVENFVMQRIYLAREDGVSRWANFMLPQDPPAVITKLETARIIQPDGSLTVFNPAKMSAATADSSNGTGGGLSMVYLPDAHAGCLIEIAYRTKHLLNASLPELYEEIPVQQDIPALLTTLQLDLPSSSHIHFKLSNSDCKPTETASHGTRIISWHFENLPAFEALPDDPPQKDLTVNLDVSSLDSWDKFVTWFRRIARGSDQRGEEVKSMAENLTTGTTNRIDKIRKAFEFVSSLRYVAVELGINGFRPRTPAVVLQNRYGDCKDKANLLIALLTDMGIEAEFTLLNRMSSTDTTFPGWQFNHAIAYVPKAPAVGQAEDLWLDTTDSTAPFPTLPMGDIGRNGLVFFKDSAKFLIVGGEGKDVTNIKEHWRFQERKEGGWSGTLEDTSTGLAEYDLRNSVRGTSPRQREYTLQTMLSHQLDNADFSNLKLPPADDLSLPMRLTAQVSCPSIPHPLPGFITTINLAPMERNRPMLLNNGQKFHVIQTVDYSYDSSPPSDNPKDFQDKITGLRASISWQRVDQHIIRRVAELEATDPLMAAADYPALRHLVREWSSRLQQ